MTKKVFALLCLAGAIGAVYFLNIGHKDNAVQTAPIKESSKIAALDVLRSGNSSEPSKHTDFINSSTVLIASKPLANSVWTNYAAQSDLKKFFDQNLYLAKTDVNAAFHLKRIWMFCSLTIRNGKERAHSALTETYPPAVNQARSALFKKSWDQCSGFDGVPSETISATITELDADEKKTRRYCVAPALRYCLRR